MEYSERCPHCGDLEWNGYDCLNCGFGSELPIGQYETPEGNIVNCTEDEAFENGYIYECECGSTILWWEQRDHGSCIHCWHEKNRKQ